ncbi:hypothetical protein M8818_000044 [Zalaria obscura]|uniref:Uncharacterized protein n=1 Tax=Zalaria obscura TaxID=2024903 RepID=A0ACC3SQ17_9PEZI
MDFPGQKEDGFKWFGEGFEGFPKRLPEDCVEYVIYVIDEKLNSQNAIRTSLRNIQKAADDLTKKLLKGYVWQREGFKLELNDDRVTSDGATASGGKKIGDGSPPCLKGRTNFGDSVADEWVIVYLLRELSKQFSDVWVRVYDTDGEFLLIEAANALPKWLNPEIAENRVWINNGQIKIIPLAQESAISPQSLSTSQALQALSKSPQALLISDDIEKEAFYRLRDYPSAITTTFHNALITIPRRLAYVLHENPSYISPAIEAFYLRDPISVKPLATKDTNNLNFPPEDFVTVSTKFNKAGYAQLRSQEFDPPPSWTSVVPRMRDPKAVMGMKVACGFEMLVQDPQNQDKRTVREIKLLLEDVEEDEPALPSDEELASWPQTQDDEGWLDINYEEFEKELAGGNRGAKGKEKAADDGFGDASAQANLRKMVERFEGFLNDDKAGVEGAEDLEDMDFDDEESTASSEPDSEGEDKDGSFSEEEFQRAMREMMGMPPDEVEKSGLLDEARKLALEMEESDEEERDEDEEMKNIMEIYEKELKGHGALNLDPKDRDTVKDGIAEQTLKGMKGAKKVEVEEDDSDEDDQGVNDIDVDLLKNMLEAFKGQGGMAGPAGNLMRQLGINMPRDEGEPSSRKGK